MRHFCGLQDNEVFLEKLHLFVTPFYLSDPKSDQIFPTSLLVLKKMSDKRGGSPDHPFSGHPPVSTRLVIEGGNNKS